MSSFIPPLERQRAAITLVPRDDMTAQPHAWAARLLRWCDLCLQRTRQRKVLASLEDHLLGDIGVTRQQAKAEAAKPFWK